jgi:regulator of replication initiation timing
MTRQRKITTAVSLRRREAAARRTQDATGPAAEIERLRAHVTELLAKIHQLKIANAGLQRRLDDIECCAEEENDND